MATKPKLDSLNLAETPTETTFSIPNTEAKDNEPNKPTTTEENETVTQENKKKEPKKRTRRKPLMCTWMALHWTFTDYCWLFWMFYGFYDFVLHAYRHWWIFSW